MGDLIMNTIMTKSIFLTSVLLIFSGLLVSAGGQNASEHDFFSSQIPSERTMASTGIFGSSDNKSGAPQKAGGNWGGDDGSIGGGDGGTEDPDCVYNDNGCPVGSGVYILMLLLSTYGGMVFLRRKKIIV